MTGIRDWDLRPDGNLLIGPAIGWDTAIAPMTALLRLRYALSEEEYETGGRSAQVVLTAVQARQLSEDLRRMADALDDDNLPHGTAQ
ncbi:hypothetical protein OMP43_21740 [Sphingomonas sp. CBMAI 2297]|uniref:hypothetical protein n=1 Tax=Sphingomonas sp. CBMAI 2297 TaxID=2991720 RepID=UPI002457CF0D|nr:hypothetical protein [Sphingomonas sp. CBMAI 2297]MDH4746653.1 hypothetical protein [Sphingomonas sp. CBMAI 2297]